jgi:hypothetical protein
MGVKISKTKMSAYNLPQSLEEVKKSGSWNLSVIGY